VGARNDKAGRFFHTFWVRGVTVIYSCEMALRRDLRTFTGAQKQALIDS
jgi:hypothetical protein